MYDEKRTISIVIDTATEQLLQEVAARKGVSVEQFCNSAVHNELDKEATVQKFSAKGMIAAGEAIFRGRISATDSADLIREAREERHRNL